MDKKCFRSYITFYCCTKRIVYIFIHGKFKKPHLKLSYAIISNLQSICGARCFACLESIVKNKYPTSFKEKLLATSLWVQKKSIKSFFSFLLDAVATKKTHKTENCFYVIFIFHLRYFHRSDTVITSALVSCNPSEWRWQYGVSAHHEPLARPVWATI